MQTVTPVFPAIRQTTETELLKPCAASLAYAAQQQTTKIPNLKVEGEGGYPTAPFDLYTCTMICTHIHVQTQHTHTYKIKAKKIKTKTGFSFSYMEVNYCC